MNVKSINQEEFVKEVLNSDIPVLVDFWAAWCGPCRSVAPVLEKIAEENTNNLKVVKVNIDENPELAGLYGIRSIPAFKIFNEGHVELEFGGALPKSQFDVVLTSYLNK